MATVELSKENFEKVITESPMVIVDFWAPWCGPCRGFAPIYDKAAKSLDMAKVHQEIAAREQQGGQKQA